LGFNVGKLEATARELLLGSRVFSPLRFGYQYFFDRERYAHRLRMRKFYASFIQKGDLVFDVGAHIGRYSEIFTDLGAKVVSVEPNPHCCKQLRLLAKVRDVHVEPCAAGDTPGKLKLRICDDSVLSTVADEYYEEASKAPIHKHAHWMDSVDVDVVTLDQLAGRYGIPAFVKIDAEGYDDHVLRGMSFQPKALTFEYAQILPQVASRCFETPVLSSGYEFNFSRGLGSSFASEAWLSAEELRTRLPEFAGSEVYGDVVARSITSLVGTTEK
jgi:FkbM family methyltransferase